MVGVPRERRLQMVRRARQRLTEARSERPLPCVIPLAAEGWERVLDDSEAGLNGQPLLEDEFEALLATAAASPGELRSAADGFADEVVAAATELRFIQAFEPAAPDRAEAVRTRLIDAALIALDVAVGDVAEGRLSDARLAVARATGEITAVTSTFDFPGDLCLAAFGVARAELIDERGIFSASRLLASYYGQYNQLRIRLATLLSVLTERPPHLLNGLAPAEALALSGRPLVTLRTAIRTRDLLQAKMSEDIEALAQPLRELKLAVDRSAASHAAMVRLDAQRLDASTAEERAVFALDIYRRVAEGQLRRWGWTLLRILGRNAAKAPELSSLRDQLLATGHPLLADAAAGILPDARNAAAHEDYEWDDDRRVLRTSDTELDPEEIDIAADLAYAFVLGAEAAWRCARTSEPDFAERMDSDDPEGGLSTINVRAAVHHFGTNGLPVRRWTHADGILTVVLDDISFRRINPCFQAVMWASRVLEGTQRFVVATADGERDAMDLPRAPLDATFVVWREAFGRFSAMPVTTFLPANAWARLAVELPDAAALASAWHALNDVVHAYNEAENTPGPIDDRVPALVDRLDLVTTAVAATMAVLPTQAVDPLAQVIELTRPAATAAASVLRGLGAASAAHLENRIRDLYESWPSASVLPTVDPRPLDVISP